jgi:hypothetical protein
MEPTRPRCQAMKTFTPLSMRKEGSGSVALDDVFYIRLYVRLSEPLRGVASTPPQAHGQAKSSSNEDERAKWSVLLVIDMLPMKAVSLAGRRHVLPLNVVLVRRGEGHRFGVLTLVLQRVALAMG